MQHENGGSRRVDLGDETLLLDADAGRVVRLRGAAREAIDGANTPEARAAIGHLAALGVLDGDSDSVEGVTADVTRRGVLSASAAAALGVTVMALPTAAAAVSLGGSSETQPTQFVQVAQAAAPGDVAPSGSGLLWSFVYGGRIHILDHGAPWRFYVFTTDLATVEVINVTGLPSTLVPDWNRASEFVISGDFAYIASHRDSLGTALPRYLDVVRLALPLVPVEGAVAATVWSIDVSSQVAAENLTGFSWTFTDFGGVERTVLGSPLTPEGQTTTVTDVTWRSRLLQLGRIVVDGGKLYAVLRCESLFYQVTYNYNETDSETVVFELRKYVLLSLDTTATPTPTPSFTTLGIDLLIFDYVGARTRPSANPTTNFETDPATAALLRSGVLLFVSPGDASIDLLRIPVANPANRTVVHDIALPAALTSISVAFSIGAPTALRLGDRLLICARARLAADSSDVGAVVGIDLAQATPTVTEYVLIPASIESYAPIAYDGTYLYAGFINPDFRFGVARLTTNPLGWDATALAGDGAFGSHLASTAQPTATGVLTAGWSYGSFVPFALFAGITPT